MGTKFNWAGTKIMLYPLTRGKRTLCASEGDVIIMDMRDFIIPPNRPEIITAFNMAALPGPPTEKEERTFDQRALMCWRSMVGSLLLNAPTAGPQRLFEYASDPRRKNGIPVDFWQLPAETLARRRGDCEDLAILMASLMIGTGISPYCVRVVIGGFRRTGALDDEPTDPIDASSVPLPDAGTMDHAWVVYKAEDGTWYLIDPAWGPHMFVDTISQWYSADGCDDGIMDSRLGDLRYHYTPATGFNNEHAWQIFPA